MRRVLSAAVALLLILTVGLRADDEPTTAPSDLAVNDAAAVKAAVGKTVSVKVKVKSAKWSSTGKVMNVVVENVPDTKFTLAVFVKAKETLDKAFSGDFGKAITGAEIRVTGKLGEFKEKPQIVIDKAEQVTIVTPAPTTKPAE